MDKIKQLINEVIKNGILNCYKIDSHICINNFLQGGIGKGNLFYYDGYCDEIELFYEKNYLNSEGFFTESMPYNPVSTRMVEGVMLLDALFRASAKCSHKPLTVYRGISSLDNNDYELKTLLSTSLDKYVAYKFAKSKMMQFDLNKNFPIIDLAQLLGNTAVTVDYCAEFIDEKEILLPPCSGVIKNKSKLMAKGSYNMDIVIDYFNVELTPLSLAQVFLQRMKNLPSDFPNRFVNDKDYEFAKSKRRLERYIKNFVLCDKIPEVSDIVSGKLEGGKKFE